MTQENLNATSSQIVIEVPDSLSNFDALMQSYNLKFLVRMDPEYDSNEAEFWKKSDTTKVNARKIRIFRVGNCKDTSQENLTYKNCAHHEYLTINVFKKKVVQYSVDSKELSAIIEFVYDKKGKLMRYVENGKLSKLSYDDKGLLIQVYCYAIENGEQKLKSTINFKRSN